jgi:membrane fusion protein (multidrug efflux system)
MRMALVAILAVVLSVGGFLLWKYVQSYQNTDDAEVDGYLDPISTRINRTVSAVYVDNNQSVKAGRVLVQLDPQDYQVAVEQARAQLAQAQADLKSARIPCPRSRRFARRTRRTTWRSGTRSATPNSLS